MIKSKIEQAITILDELQIDMWIVFCRETDMVKDPSLDLVVGEDVSGSAAFIFTRSGYTIAYLWKHDAANIQRLNCFNSVLTYTDHFKETFLTIIEKHNPGKIALNYSKYSSTYDGITHGMFLKMVEYLSDTPYAQRIISAEQILFKLRGIKTDEEIERIRRASVIADTCWHKSLQRIAPGMSEKQIASILKETISQSGTVISFDPVVNAGVKSVPGHGLPTDAVLEKGDLLHVDFGVKYEGYCSDIQRVAYFKKEDENNAPDPLIKAFNKVRTIIDVTANLYKPGALGRDIDSVARKMLTDDGYPEYQHSLGHQVGQAVHDGGSRIGPMRENDQTPLIPLEERNVFTVELGIEIHGIGYTGIEEMLVVASHGGEFLGPRQTTLTVI